MQNTILQLSPDNRAMPKIGPKTTPSSLEHFQCTFHKFGTSGEVEKHDALCLLPLNIVNEKVYIFLWFWSVIIIDSH